MSKTNNQTVQINPDLLPKRSSLENFELGKLSFLERLLHSYSFVELFQHFEEELRAKNKAYDFINQQGLEKEFYEYSIKPKK